MGRTQRRELMNIPDEAHRSNKIGGVEKKKNKTYLKKNEEGRLTQAERLLSEYFGTRSECVVVQGLEC